MEVLNYPDAPLELIEPELGGLALAGETRLIFSHRGYERKEIRFKAGDDWLKSLRFRCRNVSGKQTVEVSATLLISHPTSRAV